MNPIDMALNAGHSIEKILKFLGETDPALASKINLAISAGYPLEKVLSFIRGAGRSVSKMLPKEESNSLDLHGIARKSVHPALETVGKGALSLASLTAGGLALRGLGSAAMAPEMGTIRDIPRQAMQGQIPYQQAQLPLQARPQLPGPGAAPAGPPPTPPQPMPSPSPMQATPGQQINQGVTTPAPAGQVAQAAQATPQVNAQQLVQQLGLQEQIENMRNAGNSPDQIAQFFEATIPAQGKKAIEAQTKKPIADLVREYIAQTPQAPVQKLQPMSTEEAQKQAGIQIEPQIKQETNRPVTEAEFINAVDQGTLHPDDVSEAMEILFHPSKNTPPLSIEERIDKLRKIGATEEEIEGAFTPELKKQRATKGSEVLTPSGIGTIKGEDSKGFLVESEGKTTRIPKEQAITSPLPKKELAQLFDDLVEGIETETGQEISKMVNMAGYNEEFNELFFKGWDGDLYIFDEIPKEDANQLVNFLNRKTTGRNHIGTWVEGTNSPIGAAMSALFKKLQAERGKGKEYKRKYKLIYEALEPGRVASKEAYKEGQKANKPKKEPAKTAPKKSKIDVLNDKLGKAHDKLLKMDEDFAKEKNIDPKKRAKDISKYNEQQKIVDDLRDTLAKLEADEMDKKRKK